MKDLQWALKWERTWQRKVFNSIIWGGVTVWWAGLACPGICLVWSQDRERTERITMWEVQHSQSQHSATQITPSSCEFEISPLPGDSRPVQTSAGVIKYENIKKYFAKFSFVQTWRSYDNQSQAWVDDWTAVSWVYSITYSWGVGIRIFFRNSRQNKE